MNCTICIAKTKALISFAVTAKLICVFVFPYTKNLFSHDAALLWVLIRIVILMSTHNKDFYEEISNIIP